MCERGEVMVRCDEWSDNEVIDGSKWFFCPMDTRGHQIGRNAYPVHCVSRFGAILLVTRARRTELCDSDRTRDCGTPRPVTLG